MITKENRSKTKNGRVRVTFAMPALEDCNCLYLVGRFGECPESVYRMQRAEDGTWLLALELESAGRYQYRYRTDRGVWIDDRATGARSTGVSASDNSAVSP